MKNHKCDEWYLMNGESIVIESDGSDNLIGMFECNYLDCKKKKKFVFDITNVREVKL